MAFNRNNLRSIASIGKGSFWGYKTEDSLSTVVAAGYFDDADNLMIGDRITCIRVSGLGTTNEVYTSYCDCVVISKPPTIVSVTTGYSGIYDRLLTSSPPLPPFAALPSPKGVFFTDFTNDSIGPALTNGGHHTWTSVGTTGFSVGGGNHADSVGNMQVSAPAGSGNWATAYSQRRTSGALANPNLAIADFGLHTTLRSSFFTSIRCGIQFSNIQTTDWITDPTTVATAIPYVRSENGGPLLLEVTDGAGGITDSVELLPALTNAQTYVLSLYYSANTKAITAWVDGELAGSISTDDGFGGTVINSAIGFGATCQNTTATSRSVSIDFLYLEWGIDPGYRDQ